RWWSGQEISVRICRASSRSSVTRDNNKTPKKGVGINLMIQKGTVLRVEKIQGRILGVAHGNGSFRFERFGLTKKEKERWRQQSIQS
ncbi:MAG: hypothetical protein KC944_12680, partial [Candidatus Omnitrophica bacterium]|nr:hypothetical protein [Candidatus Omnitrophota bacterium]